jgi:hypothetical protein
MSKAWLAIFMLVSLLGCSSASKQLNPEAYVRWCNNAENKLLLVKEIQDFKYALQFKPAAFIALQESKSIKNIDSTVFYHRILELENTLQFNLQLSTINNESILNPISGDDYFQRLAYLTTSLNNDLFLLSENDTIPCTFYHFERNYNIAPYVTVVFGFETSQIPVSKAYDIVYNDQLLGAGPLIFNYPVAQLKNIPALNL